MAPTVVTSGTVTTSTTLTAFGTGTPFTTSGTYVLNLDLNALAAGDVITLSIFTKAISTSTARIYQTVTFVNAQTGEPNFQSIPIVSPYSIEFMIQHATGGSARSIDYAIMTL